MPHAAPCAWHWICPASRDGAPQLVQAGQRGPRLGVQVGIDVVLPQREAVLLGQLQHAEQLRHRRDRVGGALLPRLREEDLGPVLRDQRFQRGQVVAASTACGRAGAAVQR